MWIGGTIPEQVTLKIVEQTLFESREFKRYDIDQVKLSVLEEKSTSYEHFEDYISK